MDGKRVRDKSEYFSAGPLVVTPQKIASTIDLTSMSDQTTDAMLYRVQNRAFRDTGVVQEILNVDTGEMEEMVSGGKQKITTHKKMRCNLELVRDIVGHTL